MTLKFMLVSGLIALNSMTIENNYQQPAIDNKFSDPAPRHLEQTAYDRKRNTLILFGGVEIQDKVFREQNYISEWDGRKWIKSEANGPVGRRGHALVYDDGKSTTILMGGVTQSSSAKDSLLFDCWSWNGKKWKAINSICPVKSPKAVYDPINERILVHGDASDKSKEMYGKDQVFELWELKSNKWTKLSGEGPQPGGPYEPAYDHKRGVLIIPDWEGTASVVWEWKGEWKKHVDSVMIPVSRNRYAFVYHPVENVCYLFGGRDSQRNMLGDFWKWEGNNWSRIESSVNPAPRASFNMEYGKNELVLYGGAMEKGKLSNEIWCWKNGSWKLER